METDPAPTMEDMNINNVDERQWRWLSKRTFVMAFGVFWDVLGIAFAIYYTGSGFDTVALVFFTVITLIMGTLGAYVAFKDDHTLSNAMLAFFMYQLIALVFSVLIGIVTALQADEDGKTEDSRTMYAFAICSLIGMPIMAGVTFLYYKELAARESALVGQV